MSFIAELKRRNVIRTAVAYLAAAWLLIQVFESLLPVLGLPDTAMRYVFIALAIGFVPVMFAVWVFELTPDGLIRDSGVDKPDYRSDSMEAWFRTPRQRGVAAIERFEQEKHRPYQLHGLATVLHDLGDTEGSAAAMNELLQIFAADPGPEDKWDWGFARAYAWMGDADKAFMYIERDRLVHGPRTGAVNNPYFARIQGDPRWQSFVDSTERESSKIQFNPKLPPEILAIQ